MNYWGNWYIKFLILDMKFRFTTMALVKSKNTMNWIVANFLRCQWHFLWIHSIIPNTGDSDNQYFTGTLKTWFSFFIFFYSSFILSSFFPLGTVAQWNTVHPLWVGRFLVQVLQMCLTLSPNLSHGSWQPSV